MAEMAFVRDISGVCSRRDTRRMTPTPMKVASMNTNSMDQKSSAGGASCMGLLLLIRWPRLRGAEAGTSVGRSTRADALPGLSGPLVTDLALVGDDRSLLDVVGQVQAENILLGERQEEGRQVAPEQQAGVRRHGRRQVQGRDDAHAVLDDRLAGP